MTSYFIGELLGTMTLIVFGSGVVANTLLAKSKGENAGWLAIVTGWFIAVVFGVFVAQSAGSPNADINPCVTLAKFYMGMYTTPQLLNMWLAQLLGSMLGATIAWLAYYPHWKATSNTAYKLAVFCTSPAIRHYPSNLIAEILGATLLIFCIGALFGHTTLHPISHEFEPYLVGILVWGIGLSLGGTTGYAINPARDLGPRIMHAILPIGTKGSSDWAYAWVPVIGPFIGGLIGGMLWKCCF